ncbi:MAG: bifunctional serine/threonine-protein kinase/formylglycine-generating enzyme family protein [Gammaproteobacteria bacterium]|nr:bifunctional serine/threonine-protein kinase/formylglycine-generating enzyme family protein [Gammaproteobacteria bacterium]
MADFKKALEALAEGKLDIDVLSQQLKKLLQDSPKFAQRMLVQLDDIYDQKKIGDTVYATLKSQINKYRRAHADETENADEAGGNATVFAKDKDLAQQQTQQQAETDSTKVLSDDERPGMVTNAANGTSGVDFDISGISSITGATGPTGTEWQEPQPADSGPGGDLDVGDIIKERFKLLAVLGIGGMGKVFKGIDLLKEEARDKNPYVAIKLLNEDFKSHPEAFISLQRESSRQQKLAHPNIATVYDFDRIGGPGTPVYITMELMEGQDLSAYIKKVVRKQGGLPFAEAFDLISQLGLALEYAHNRRLVHSDFKPGNCFLCNDGTVKTLDFGIARAVKNPITGVTEKTLFDPGKLGALTPAYASLEMLEGEEPDTRDDTYALGCVAYELLTGKHPFNKLPATTARENGLVPATVKGLNKKQNRALRRAVAFKREDRCQTVPHFIEELEGKITWHKNPIAIAAGVLLVAGLIAINPVLDYLHNKEIETIIAQINNGDKQVILAKLDEIRTMQKADQTMITDNAKAAIQSYFKTDIAGLINISSKHYNFPAAEAKLKEIAQFYPDTQFLLEQSDQIKFNKKQKITDLYNDYIIALKDITQVDKTKNILAIISQQIDPNHPLLQDPRPANAYRLFAEQAFSDNDFDQALAFIGSGLQTAPNDVRLSDLQTKVQQAVRVAELNQSLAAAQAQLIALGDFQQYQQDIKQLANLSTSQQSPILNTIATQLQKAVTQELKSIMGSGSRADAETLAAEYGDLLSALQLGRQLTQVKLAHLSGAERSQAITEIVAADKSSIEQQLAEPSLEDPQWESSLLASIRELDSLKQEDSSINDDLQGFRQSIAQLYVDQANDTLRANRFDAANGFIDRGQRFAPALAMLQQTRNVISKTRTEFEKQQRIKELKDDFTVQTDGDRVAKAKAIFAKLKAALAADDPYITTQAPARLADSYYRLAQRRGDNKQFESALKLAEAGLQLAPGNAVLKSIRNEYRIEVNIAELAELFKIASTFDALDVARKVNQIEADAPARYTAFRKQSETILTERINFLAQTDENAAAALAVVASNVFKTSSVLADLKEQFQLKPWPDQSVANAALDSGKLSEANRILQAAIVDYAGHPDIIALQTSLEIKIKQANTAYDAYLKAKQAAGDAYAGLRQSRKLLARTQSIWIDNPDYDKAETKLDQLIANAPDNPTKKVIRRERVDLAAVSKADLIKAKETWKPISSGRECTNNLAGYGERAKAICFDLVNSGWRGPLMVVVPAGEASRNPFAIGKYEISVGDYAKYCALSGNCKTETDKQKFNDPVTGTSFDDAVKYVKWLSERTGKTYRLPTMTEWEYAANAAGKQPKKDVNCRVMLGDKVLKGTGTVSVKSGKANGWGLKNYVGNVQEMVTNETGPLTVGGAYSDSHSKCDISLRRPYNGNPNSSTGFRVLLEDVG